MALKPVGVAGAASAVTSGDDIAPNPAPRAGSVLNRILHHVFRLPPEFDRNWLFSDGKLPRGRAAEQTRESTDVASESSDVNHGRKPVLRTYRSPRRAPTRRARGSTPARPARPSGIATRLEAISPESLSPDVSSPHVPSPTVGGRGHAAAHQRAHGTHTGRSTAQSVQTPERTPRAGRLTAAGIPPKSGILTLVRCQSHGTTLTFFSSSHLFIRTGGFGHHHRQRRG